MQDELLSCPPTPCPGCAYHLGHAPTCSLRPKTEREQGWNEAIEAAAKEMEQEAVDARRVGASVMRAGGPWEDYEARAIRASARATRIRALKK